MKNHSVSRLGIAAFLAASPWVLGAAEASAELKVGLGIEKMDIKDPSETFKVEPGTKLYAWSRITGCEGSSVTFAFEKDGKAVFQKELEVPRSPHRTNACRTFRAGDGGSWTVKLLGKDGKELASTAFTVDVK